MVDVLARNWGMVALRGVLALLFGLLTLFNPAISLVTLVYLYGAYALVDGIFTVVSVIANRRGQQHWVAVLLGGLAGIAAGVITFLMPGLTATILLLFIAAWAIVTGVTQIVAAIRLRKEISGEWLMVFAGILSVVFGVFLAANPGAGALALVLWIGAYAIVLGIILIALAFRLRHWAHDHTMGAMPHPA
jgi:uncharacterized membrane protein HdeD (DUF308 family)